MVSLVDVVSSSGDGRAAGVEAASSSASAGLLAALYTPLSQRRRHGVAPAKSTASSTDDDGLEVPVLRASTVATAAPNRPQEPATAAAMSAEGW